VDREEAGSGRGAGGGAPWSLGGGTPMSRVATHHGGERWRLAAHRSQRRRHGTNPDGGGSVHGTRGLGAGWGET
jgi:hypothetical protein